MTTHTPSPPLASPTRPATRPPAPMGLRPWTLDRVREVLSGTMDPAAIREVDRLGLSAPTYAAMQGALAADSLLQLLDQPEGASQGQQIIELLMAIGEAQVRTEQRLSAIEASLVSLALRSGTQRAIVDLTARLCAGPGQPVAITTRTIRKVAAADDLSAERRQRRGRWIAAQLRRYYDMGWLPVSVADRIVRIEIDEQSAAVILTLTSGTKLIDRLTRIDVIGVVDDITVAELVEAVRRRGWSAVSVMGDETFRRAVAWSMASADPPVEVINSPLTWEELADIDAMKAPSRWAVPEPPRPRMR